MLVGLIASGTSLVRFDELVKEVTNFLVARGVEVHEQVNGVRVECFHE